MGDYIDIIVNKYLEGKLTERELIEIAQHSDDGIIRKAIQEKFPDYFKKADISKLTDEQKAELNLLVYEFVREEAEKRSNGANYKKPRSREERIELHERIRSEVKKRIDKWYKDKGLDVTENDRAAYMLANQSKNPYSRSPYEDLRARASAYILLRMFQYVSISSSIDKDEKRRLFMKYYLDAVKKVEEEYRHESEEEKINSEKQN